MDHQMTLEEFGISLEEDPASVQKRIHEKVYAFPCGGCICNHCANNVECSDKTAGEAEFGCFTCDDCKHYGGKGCHEDNWRARCSRYRITDAYAEKLRRKFRRINGGGREENEQCGRNKAYQSNEFTV